MAELADAKDLVAEFLRARITDPRSRLTSNSDSFTATGGQTEFVLTPATAGHQVKAITSVTQNAVAINKWQDYAIDLANKKITLATGATVSDAMVVNYLASAAGNNWIYPDKPVATLGDSNFPRISITLVGITTDRLGHYSSDVKDDCHFQIDCWTKDGYTPTIGGIYYTKQALANYLGQQIKNAFKDNVNDLFPKLWDYSGLVFRDMDFDKKTQTYRHNQEVLLSGTNVG